MLKFDDMEAVDDYLEIVGEVRSDHETDDDSEQLLSDVDPGVNALEGALEFLCLSSLYDSLEYLDYEFRSNARSTLDIYIPDSELQVLLNRDHEVWIEDTIYKIVDDYKFYKIVGADIDVLNSIRSDPENPTVDDNTILEYFNNNVPFVSFNTNICSLKIVFVGSEPPPAHGIDPTIHIDVKMEDQNQNLSVCGYSYVRIFWGDGENTYVLNHSYISHQYEVGANETETFTIQAQLFVLTDYDCLGCDAQTYIATTTYTVTNEYCKLFNTDNTVLQDVSFSAGGGNWKYRGVGGQTTRFNFLNDPKVWGEIFTYKQNGGNFHRKRPDIKAYVRIFKSTFNHDDCENGDDTFDSYFECRDNRVRVIDKAMRPFSTQDELSEEPLLDFKEFITSSVTPNSTRSNIELHPN